MMEMRAGEIATDADSGPGNHFKFTVPVEAVGNYLVKVEGTDGVYQLAFAFAQVASANTITPPNNLSPASLNCAGSDRMMPMRFVLLRVRNRKEIDICSTSRNPGLCICIQPERPTYVGILYGPDGTLIIEDDNGGDGVTISGLPQNRTRTASLGGEGAGPQ